MLDCLFRLLHFSLRTSKRYLALLSWRNVLGNVDFDFELLLQLHDYGSLFADNVWEFLVENHDIFLRKVLVCKISIAFLDQALNGHLRFCDTLWWTRDHE